jgi:broad specificity phosphatase PhoE
MRALRIISLFVFLVSVTLAVAQNPSTIILVRHAEKAGPTGDVPLNDAGLARAQTLAHVLIDAGVKNIFVTEFKRTKETAAPAAAQFHLTPEVRPAADVDRFVAELRKMPAGSTTLVVGHSNTIPSILEKLGAGPVKAIEDAEYDYLLIVTLYAGKARLLTLRY